MLVQKSTHFFESNYAATGLRPIRQVSMNLAANLSPATGQTGSG